MSEKQIIRVRDVMKTEFDLVDGTLTVGEALSQMEHKSAKALIVNRRNEDDEFGILLLSDIAKQVLAKDRSPERVNVYEIMAKPVISVAPEMNVRYCARLFSNFGLSLAPVIENRKALGIVSYTDMVLHGFHAQYDPKS